MTKCIYSCIIPLLGLVFLFVTNTPVNSQAVNPPISAQEIIEKNLEASGGKSKLDALTTLSFEMETTIFYRRIITTFYASSQGQMKILEGDGELIEKITLVDIENPENIQVKSFAPDVPLTSFEKIELTSLARLCSGGFSLKNFAGKLSFSGLKKYGPDKLYVLTMPLKDYEVDIYVDANNYLLKRLILKGTDQEQGKYETDYDFGPPMESHGLNIPSFIYRSYIRATTRPPFRLTVNNFKTNFPLAKNFFNTSALNFGETKISEGKLEGNAVFSLLTPLGNIVLTVNWTNADIEKAGFKTGDKLKLKIGDDEFDATFVKSGNELTPADLDPANKKVLLTDLDEDPYWQIGMISGVYKPFHEKFKKLTKVSAQKLTQNGG